MNKKKKNTGISPSTYHSLLKDISQIYSSALSDGNENWNKAALYSNWKIGERIVKIEQGNQERASYGDRILKELSRDLNRTFGKGFSERNLRNMRKFYQLFTAKEIHPELTWSHYLLLLLIEDKRHRLVLEKKAIREGLSYGDFWNFVDKVVAGQARKSGTGKEDRSKKDGLKRPLMELYTYRVLRNFSSNLANTLPNLDLGFSVTVGCALGDTAKDKKNFASYGSIGMSGDIRKLKVGAVVKVLKKGRGYSFESGANLKELFTYKAYLEKGRVPEQGTQACKTHGVRGRKMVTP